MIFRHYTIETNRHVGRRILAEQGGEIDCGRGDCERRIYKHLQASCRKLWRAHSSFDCPPKEGLIASLAEYDPLAPSVMAGLDPAIQTSAFRCWMPASSPGMTARVTNNEIWYYKQLPLLQAALAVRKSHFIKPNIRDWKNHDSKMLCLVNKIGLIDFRGSLSSRVKWGRYRRCYRSSWRRRTKH